MDFETWLVHPFVLLWMGQALHFAKALRDREIAGQGVSVRKFLRAHPWAIVFSIIAGLVVYALAQSMGQLNPLSAFTAGYMADSAVSAFATRGLKAIEREPEEKPK